MKRIIALALIVGLVLVIGCIGPQFPPINETQNETENYSYVEPGESIPMPSEEEMNNAESPEFPF